MNGAFGVGNEDPDSAERQILFNATEHLIHPTSMSYSWVTGDVLAESFRR